MYICICNALTERAVSKAVRDGAESPTQIFVKLGCAPQCGKCMPMLREVVGDTPAELDGQPEIAAE